MEEYQVECGECGSTMDLHGYQSHICARPPSTSMGLKLALGPSPIPTRVPTNQESSSEDTLVPQLIELVQARPALWDHTLPLKMRGRDIKEKLWKEVQAELGHILPIPVLEKKWKNLKDTFLKNLKNFKPQSGAGTEEKKKWKYFDNMEFLSSINTPKRTISNVGETFSPMPSSLSNTSVAVESESDFGESSTPCSSRKMEKKNDNTEKLLLDILNEPAPPQNQPQLSPALLTIQSILDKLPQRVRMMAEIEMINKVYSLYEEYAED